jgi:hypothetical protein
MGIKSRDIDHQVLLFAHQCVAADNVKACLAFGIDLEDLRKMREIDVADLYSPASSLRESIISKIVIDKNGLDIAHKKSIQKRQRESTINQLLESGANNKLMAHFFSMTRQEVSNRRKILAIETGAGRPERSVTDEKEKALVADRLKQYRREYTMMERGCPVLRCQGLLSVGLQTEKTVQEVWEMIEAYLIKGKFAW